MYVVCGVARDNPNHSEVYGIITQMSEKMLKIFPFTLQNVFSTLSHSKTNDGTPKHNCDEAEFLCF